VVPLPIERSIPCFVMINDVETVVYSLNNAVGVGVQLGLGFNFKNSPFIAPEGKSWQNQK
jgi:hypothetical protein